MFTTRIKELSHTTPLEEYKRLRDDINANLNSISKQDLDEFNDKFFAKYEMMKTKDWEQHEKRLSKYVYRTDS